MKVYLVSEADYDWTRTIGAFTEKSKAVGMAEGLFESMRKDLHPTHYLWQKDWSYNYIIEEIELET